MDMYCQIYCQAGRARLKPNYSILKTFIHDVMKKCAHSNYLFLLRSCEKLKRPIICDEDESIQNSIIP